MIRRIRGRDAFARVAREGTRIRGTTLWCTYLPDPSTATTQVAFSIGRAVGPAVVRNRVRRRLRACLAALDRTGGLPPGLLLVGARATVTERTYAQVCDEVAQLTSRLASTTPPPTPSSTTPSSITVTTT